MGVGVLEAAVEGIEDEGGEFAIAPLFGVGKDFAEG